MPADICIHADGRVVLGRRHGHLEHITRTEGRALILTALHATRSTPGLFKRHRFLLDNLALSHAVNRGRSSSPALYCVVRQLSALALTAGCEFVCGWIPSEPNGADFPSRMRPVPSLREGASAWGAGAPTAQVSSWRTSIEAEESSSAGGSRSAAKAGVVMSSGIHAATTSGLGSALPDTGGFGGPLMEMKSHLETTSVSATTQTTYTESVHRFIQLC